MDQGEGKECPFQIAGSVKKEKLIVKDDRYLRNLSIILFYFSKIAVDRREWRELVPDPPHNSNPFTAEAEAKTGQVTNI